MKVKGIGFVGIPVTEMKRARAFYEGVLGLEVSGEYVDGNWIEYAVGEDTIALASVGDQWLPSDQGTCAALEVENFDEAINKLKVAVIRFSMEPTDTPVCHMAIVQDPDGNKVAIHKLKSADK